MSFLADAVVVLHLGFILFVVLGGLLALRWRWVMALHLPAAVWGTVVELFGWVCPLTPLEVYLRHQAGQQGYKGGFVDHYILPLIYPENLTRGVQVLLGVLVVVVNIVVYILIVFRWRRR